MTSILRLLSPVLVVLLALLTGLYQLRMKPVLTAAGIWRNVERVGNHEACKTVPELKACEQIILHQPTGVLYLACSEPESRQHWLPCFGNLDSEKRSLSDYVATYDPSTNEVRRLTPVGFNSPRGLNNHGMDVVVSSSNPNELFIYLVNHRPSLVGDATPLGSDESVEVFKTTVGGNDMTHVHTFEDPAIMFSLNDVVGSADGTSVYFTNEAEVVSLQGKIAMFMQIKRESVGFCHRDLGCKIAIDHIFGVNGIAKSPTNDTYYVCTPFLGFVHVLSRQADDRLVLDEQIPTDRACDNLSVDDDGVVWSAGLPKSLATVDHINNPDLIAPSSVLRMSINTGESSFFGEKYLVEKVFEDDGNFVSGMTAVVHDARRGKLFMHGVASPYLTVCDITS